MVPISKQDLVRFGVLALCAVLAVGMTRQIERKREYVRKPTRAYIDTKAVWSFAAVIALPPILASVMVVLTYLVAWFCIWPRTRPIQTYRWVFSCCTVLCGTQAAVAVLAAGSVDYPGIPDSLALDDLAHVGVIVLAATVRWVINVALVMAAIALSSPSASARDLFANFDEQFLEAGAMSLGLVTAAVVVEIPIVLPGIVFAMAAMHHGVLVNQYAQASRVDTKTGIATAGAWHEFAEQAMVRSRENGNTVGVLIVDLDHFKFINDTYGHPYGDDVLGEVGKELVAEVRDKDACGRWGGEEFAIALPEIDDAQALFHIGERIRRRIQTITLAAPADAAQTAPVSLTASVGGAVFPAEGITSLDELILAADTALYEAKNGGRNTVRLSGAAPLMPSDPFQPTKIADDLDDQR
ncbi:GGDEF domain-containing protein [Actinobacteria bacterium YIM 96077]|uniref:GGDEF domain-containing protein n=2 Tax=Phytoactinopolyspora halophila TaxID=1981511 RepID=A0A329R515_9ACTN|nr:GGDEF domain-containing protein [Actinobacteria bacterium YIM 96077]RAW18158.1 GGDEF domain-containing protein [Phytoactinopolyspora halophila]